MDVMGDFVPMFPKLAANVAQSKKDGTRSMQYRSPRLRSIGVGSHI